MSQALKFCSLFKNHINKVELVNDEVKAYVQKQVSNVSQIKFVIILVPILLTGQFYFNLFSHESQAFFLTAILSLCNPPME